MNMAGLRFGIFSAWTREEGRESVLVPMRYLPGEAGGDLWGDLSGVAESEDGSS
jgi:hypothetical protein